MEDPKELKQKLTEFETSLEELNSALSLDPKNEELLKLKADLVDVIAETRKSLQKFEKPTSPVAPSSEGNSESNDHDQSSEDHTTAEGHPTIGNKVYAQYSGDGLWYEAVVDSVTPSGSFVVTYAGYGNSEERPVELVKIPSATITLELLNSVQFKSDTQNKKRPAGPDVSKDAKKQAKYLEAYVIVIQLTFFFSGNQQQRKQRKKKRRKMHGKNLRQNQVVN